MQVQKGSFLWRNRVALVGGLVLLLGAHFISTGVRQGRFLARPQAIVLDVVSPFASAFSRAADSTHDLIRQYLWLVGVARQNRQLRGQLAAMPAIKARMAELEQQNRQLTELLALKNALHLDVVGARVIGSDATGLARTILINQGAQRGLKPGMAVVAPAGAVGKLIATSAAASRVVLLTDHDCAVDAVDQRSRARGIVSGVIEGGLIMRYVQRTDDVKVGDTLVTSGLDGSFPRGVLIGHVSRVERTGRGMFIHVAVEPAVDFHSLEQVLVIAQSPPKVPAADQG